MGQMKKLWALAEVIDRRTCTYQELEIAPQLIRSTHKSCNDALDRIRTAEALIGDFLTEGYATDLYAARSILVDAINLLEGPHDTKGAALQVRRSHEDGDHPRPGVDPGVPTTQG